jgi:hypothetical protein
MTTVTDEIQSQIARRRVLLQEACAAGDTERATGVLEEIEDLADVIRRIAESDIIRWTPWEDWDR